MAEEKQVRIIRITEGEYLDVTSDHGGYCLACGEQADGCEPDAREYECEVCGEHKVYGAEELLIMGRIEFTEGE